MYTEAQMKEYAKKQREICAESAKLQSIVGLYKIIDKQTILNAPEPELPEQGGDAVEFVEWLVKRKVSVIGGGMWEDEGVSIGGGVGVAPVRTTAELYKLFTEASGADGNP